MLTAVVISILTYICMIFSTKYRTPIATLGSSILLIYGSISREYPIDLAFQKFPTEIVILVVVLALFSKVFEINGIFSVVGKYIETVSKKDRMRMAIILPLIIYAASLFMNNLSVILLFTFICLELAVRYHLPIIPIGVSAIIASNIGGCPLPWADTPAVILTLYTDFVLQDFLSKLFIPCLIFVALLCLYTTLYNKVKPETSQPVTNNKVFAVSIEEGLKFPPHIRIKLGLPPHRPNRGAPPPEPPLHERYFVGDWREWNLPIILFVLLIIGICVAPFLGISIAFVSMLFGAILLLVVKDKPEDLLISLPILDSLVFITSLFLIAGCLEYSGVLKVCVNYIMAFTNENAVLIILCIMLSAFIISTFLSAGPAAATLLSICNQLSPIVGNKLVYAALALGILAGSSMLPWSATGGPIMLSEVRRFLKDYKGPLDDKQRISQIFSLKKYLSFSIPFSLIIFCLSGVFLTLYALLF